MASPAPNVGFEKNITFWIEELCDQSEHKISALPPKADITESRHHVR
jgi:hypothetical protein